MRQVPGWAPGRGSGIKTSYFGPGSWPPGGREPGLFLPTPPGCCSPGRLRYPEHPRLSQRHRIRSGLPGGWAEMGVGSVLCPPDSLACLPHSLYPGLCSQVRHSQSCLWGVGGVKGLGTLWRASQARGPKRRAVLPTPAKLPLLSPSLSFGKLGNLSGIQQALTKWPSHYWVF